MNRPTSTAIAIGALLTLAGASAPADSAFRGLTYDVTITNLTRGVSFTPFLVASHRSASNLLFTPGAAPGDELAALAEGGDTAPLAALLATDNRVSAIEGSAGLLDPGASVTVSIQAVPGRGYISLAAMLLPTNDGMVAVQNVPVPAGRDPSSVWAFGYDAGSEPNDELCSAIPGPHCGGAGGSPGVAGEGFVHIHPGIQGVGDLAPAAYDWRNPVALVTITRVR